ncbi:MAG: hypothetical protein WCO03_00020 [bacterium]
MSFENPTQSQEDIFRQRFEAMADEDLDKAIEEGPSVGEMPSAGEEAEAYKSSFKQIASEVRDSRKNV